MATHAVALPSQTPGAALCARALHAWHLFSLDAPSVALCWTLLFAHAAHVSHAWPAALALACAVWIVYAGDRLLDALRSDAGDCPLSALYRCHRRGFLLAVAGVAGVCCAFLFKLPATLQVAWVALALPLLIYAVAVHRLRLPGAWKSRCVGIFFAVAVSLPGLLQNGFRWEWIAAAAGFGGVCWANCRLLRQERGGSSWAWSAEAFLCEAWAVMPLLERDTRSIAVACGAAILLLWCLHRWRTKFAPLTYRGLVDAALVAPALFLLLLG